MSFIGLQRGRNSERSRIIGQIPDPTVRATIKDDLRALLHDPTIDAAWTAIADLCDQAMAGKAHLVGVGAQLYALDGAVTSFTEIIDGDPSWKNLATLFLRLSAHVIGAVQAPDALFRVLVIEVYPGYASALETGRGPIDENSGIEAAYRLLDMIGAYCLWSQAAAQGNPLP